MVRLQGELAQAMHGKDLLLSLIAEVCLFLSLSLVSLSLSHSVSVPQVKSLKSLVAARESGGGAAAGAVPWQDDEPGPRGLPPRAATAPASEGAAAPDSERLSRRSVAAERRSQSGPAGAFKRP
jgi:hypothetical protein